MESDATEWKPTAKMSTLKARATMLKRLREFFDAQGVLEVETPILSEFSGTDANLMQWQTTNGYFLHTSPEFSMKRLLAAGSGDIFQICKVFRLDEVGQRHNPEFSMLEWYRTGWDEFRLIEEVASLVSTVCQQPELTHSLISYRSAFEQAGLPNPHSSSLVDLQRAVVSRLNSDAENWSYDDCLDALMCGVVEQSLDPNRLTFIYDYPQSQAALAKLKNVDGCQVAHRFELFWQGMELANGYLELTDFSEQNDRMLAEAEARVSADLPAPEIDIRFLAALKSGLPDCAGVALGLDRLMMIDQRLKNISDVISFPTNIA